MQLEAGKGVRAGWAQGAELAEISGAALDLHKVELQGTVPEQVILQHSFEGQAGLGLHLRENVEPALRELRRVLIVALVVRASTVLLESKALDRATLLLAMEVLQGGLH